MGAVVRICRQLDGIPLAIELASAQVNVLTVEQIAARLDACFAGTVTAPHMTTSPHRTMRAALDWSHDLLTASEQAVLRRLSAFPGSCTLDMAEAVCAGDGIEPEQVLGLLASLVRKSLVVADTSSGPEARYDLLDLVRQYAQERLREAGEWAVTCDRMLEITVHLAEEAAPHLLGPHQGRWFSQLEAGMDTLRAALAWALEQGHIASGVRIAVALFQFWDRRWHTREGFGWFARLIPHLDETLPLDLRVAALTYASYLAMFLVDAPAASAWSRRALALCEAAGDDGQPLTSLALSGAVGAPRVAGEPETAYRISAQILERDRAMPDNLIYGMQLYIHGYLAVALGHYADAHAALDEARKYARAGSDPYRMAIILQTEGDLARCEGQHQEAVRHYEDSLTLLQELSASGRDVADTERGLAFAWLRLGDLQRAHALFAHSLDGQQAQDNRLGMAQALRGMAALAVATGNLHAAARLDGFVAAYRVDVPILLEPADAADQLDFTSFSASLRGQLSEASTEVEQAAGRRMTLPQAVTYALSLPLPAQSETVLDALTPREREITALIARGLSNGDIADALFLSKRTVEKHIAHILSKLGLANRVQVVRWAADHDLTGS